MISVNQKFKELKDRGDKAFVAYLTAGDPHIEATKEFIKALISGGADIVEIGVPFSDPLADGPTNQKAAMRALKNNCNLEDIFKMVFELRREGLKTPFVLFTYLNPVYQYGLDQFCEKAQECELGGVLFLDLPVEAAGPTIQKLNDHKVETIFLASPTTSPERIRLINQSSSGFIYYVSTTGVTGVRSGISSSLAGELSSLYKLVDKPVAVGFGISERDQVDQIAEQCDGVVVGSAIVNKIEAMKTIPQCTEELKTYISNLTLNLKRGE